MGNTELMAVVTINKEAVGGDVPIFFASTEEEQAKIANTLAQVLRSMVHDVGNGVYCIVRH
ncbi:MAG: hypothetical protein CVU89_15060 [Firmicutes bacterium HGW-Firmicutes-14]|jgi:hypothetical protein|nr:MAG: hypothetical protein CVU89_15060 [Firmicutes bacterium HGW-Firmicutes-14]